MAHLLKRAGGGGAAADPLPDPKSRGVGLDVKQDRQERKVMPNRHGGPGTSAHDSRMGVNERGPWTALVGNALTERNISA
jgi:hypothetical protein